MGTYGTVWALIEPYGHLWEGRTKHRMGPYGHRMGPYGHPNPNPYGFISAHTVQ